MQPKCPEVHDLVCRYVTGNLSSLEPKQTHFLLALALQLNDDFIGNPSIEELAEHSNLSLSSVKRAKKELGGGVFECVERRAGREYLRTTYIFSREVLEGQIEPVGGGQDEPAQDATLVHIEPVCLIRDIDVETHLPASTHREEQTTTPTSTPKVESIQPSIDILVQIEPVCEEEEEEEEEELTTTGPEFDWRSAYEAREAIPMLVDPDEDGFVPECAQAELKRLAERREQKRLEAQRANLDELCRTLSEAAQRCSEANSEPTATPPAIPLPPLEPIGSLFTEEEVAELLPSRVREERQPREVKCQSDKPYAVWSDSDLEQLDEAMRKLPIYLPRPSRQPRPSQRTRSSLADPKLPC